MSPDATHPPRPLRVGVISAAICTVLLVASTCFVLNAAGLYPMEQLKTAAFVAATVFLPGWVISATWPTTRRLDAFTRLGLSFVCGLGPHLLGWLLAVRLQEKYWLYVPSVAVTLVGGIVRLMWGRHHRRTGERRRAYGSAIAAGYETPEPRSTALAIGTPIMVLLAWLLLLRSAWDGIWSWNSVRHPSHWYQDLYWHVSLTSEAMRHAPLHDPQSAVEGPLSYHWFANAHSAAIVMATGVDLNAVTLIAAFIPAAFATVALVYGLTRYLASSTLGAALATILLMLPIDLVTLPGLDLRGANAWIWLSPSHLFALPLCVALTWLIVVLLRQRWHPAMPTKHLRTAWWLLGYLALLAPGSKVSMLPTLLGGVGLVFLMGLVRRRGWIPPLLMGIGGAAIVLVTMPLFAGGGGGSKPLFGASVLQLHLVSHAHVKPTQTLLVAALCVVLLATYSPALLAFSSRKLMKDPALIFFAGTTTAALLAVFGLQHPSMSQVYFLLGIAPIITAFVTAGIVHLVREWAYGNTVRGWIVLAATVVGLVVGVLVLNIEREPSFQHTTWVFVQAGVLIAFMLLLAMLFHSGAARGFAVLLSMFILGYSLAPAYPDFDRLYHQPPRQKPSVQTLRPEELAGLHVLATTNKDGKLVATNLHCQYVKSVHACDNRGFWVAGLGRSPVLIGGWGYSASARQDDGKNHLPYTKQPYFDQKLFKLNEDAFSHPTPSGLSELRAKGVRYLFADGRASTVSPELAKLTDVIWHQGQVWVVRLKQPNR